MYCYYGISEDLDSKLTDTIMLCSYNPKTQKAMMLSIPRDTFVGKSQAKAKGGDKINSVYSASGAEDSVKAVEEITGIDIDYYVVVNNKVVIDLVNNIGGVQFDVPIDMNYDDKTQDLYIHLKKGVQVLNGDQAEQLLRFRHNNNGTSYPSEYGDNDFGRMKTQREFMIAVLKQTLSLKNVTHIKAIMASLYSNITTDVELDDIFPYVAYAVNFDTSNITTYQLPGESKICNELWFYIHDEEKTTEIMNDIHNYLYDIQETEENETQNTLNNVIKNETSDKTNSTKNEKTSNKTNTTKSGSSTNTAKNTASKKSK